MAPLPQLPAEVIHSIASFLSPQEWARGPALACRAFNAVRWDALELRCGTDFAGGQAAKDVRSFGGVGWPFLPLPILYPACSQYDRIGLFARLPLLQTDHLHTSTVHAESVILRTSGVPLPRIFTATGEIPGPPICWLLARWAASRSLSIEVDRRGAAALLAALDSAAAAHSLTQLCIVQKREAFYPRDSDVQRLLTRLHPLLPALHELTAPAVCSAGLAGISHGSNTCASCPYRCSIGFNNPGFERIHARPDRNMACLPELDIAGRLPLKGATMQRLRAWISGAWRGCGCSPCGV